ncbi:trehalase [Eurytemora carolleeae]|uniref:trehalase n=1 Tax=Eurytemora carolleeae TaxID=1294199 RepID=UPI000C7721C9|nr:trehalase [Eurytemora carolleeae]XP_023322607.1 trehalase [Eurytemora carolleeae]XP_023322608.1 trehalase [Eurytemora carolleeae]|eukprot:XP_023322606.1 trehalase-like [Eurytemora affinis]
MIQNIKELELLTGLLTIYLLPVRSELTDWPCNHVIFCKPDSGILHTVQTLQLFQDSKTFVDMPLKFSVNETLAKYVSLQPDPSRVEVEQFVAEFFSEPGTELKEVKLRDWSENPEILGRIQDASYRKLVEILHERWQHLAREVSETIEEEKTSLIPLAHPFIVPGGRYKKNILIVPGDRYNNNLLIVPWGQVQ